MMKKIEKLSGNKSRVIGKRASAQQKEMLIDYLEKNLYFAHTLSDSQNGHELIRKEWNELAKMLNAVLGGAEKSPMNWRKYWFDLREYTKQNAGVVKQFPDGMRKKAVSPLEQKIFNIINWKPPDCTLDINKSSSIDDDSSRRLSHVGRIRNGRASDIQKEELVKYFEHNTESLKIVSNTTGDSKMKQRIWIELTHKLNSIDGVMKPSGKWAKYWNDIVSYTKNRAHRVISGQKSANCERPPTDIEKRMLRVVAQYDLIEFWEKAYATKSVSPFNYDEDEDLNNDEQKIIKAEVVDIDDDTIGTSENEELEWNESEQFAEDIGQDQDPIELAETDDKLEKKTDESALDFQTVCYEVQNQAENEFLENSNEYYEVQQYDVEVVDQPEDRNHTDNDDSADEYVQVQVISDEHEINEPNERNERTTLIDSKNCINSNINKRQISPTRDGNKSPNSKRRRSSSTIIDDNSDDKLADAIFALGSAAQSMANALNNLAKVFQERRGNGRRRNS